MQLRNSPERYGAVPKFLHWLTVALVLIAWLLGEFGDDLPRNLEGPGLNVHIAAGLAILGLLALRILWRLFDPPPAMEPTPFGHWLEVVAKLTHWALYALLAVSPIVGVLVQFAQGDALPVFGIIDIASPWVRDRALAHALKEIHETLSNALVILAAFHAAAALIHHWLFRDRTLARMLPGIAR